MDGVPVWVAIVLGFLGFAGVIGGAVIPGYLERKHGSRENAVEQLLREAIADDRRQREEAEARADAAEARIRDLEAELRRWEVP